VTEDLSAGEREALRNLSDEELQALANEIIEELRNRLMVGKLGNALLVPIGAREFRPPETPARVVRNARGNVVGWVWADGCEHPACMQAIEDGRVYHAAPLLVSLPEYHFATEEEAEQALLTRGIPEFQEVTNIDIE